MQNCNFEAESLVCMVTIVNRGHAEKIAQHFAGQGVTYDLLFLGKGTADSAILDYLGLGETEKDILFSTMSYTASKAIMSQLAKETNIRLPGHGIAFTLPIGSVCGVRAERCIRGVASEAICEGEKIMERSNHDLIIAITNRGYSNEIMEAARSAKATGGTVFHARRLGQKEAEKFFGVTIQEEKEILFILSDAGTKQGIMQAITARSGLNTEAKTVVFSLPVNDVLGLTDTLPEEK